MRDHVIGLAAIAALLLVAYGASEQTTAGWRASAAAVVVAPRVAGSEIDGRKPISDAEAVVGRPHDGIRALPARRVERKNR